jgi:hypothetical protein
VLGKLESGERVETRQLEIRYDQVGDRSVKGLHEVGLRVDDPGFEHQASSPKLLLKENDVIFVIFDDQDLEGIHYSRGSSTRP